MSNNHVANISNAPTKTIQVDARNAYHQAGHAAAIVLGNRQKQLPDCHFQVAIKSLESDCQISTHEVRLSGQYMAVLEGGQLFERLPFSLADDSLPEAPIPLSKARQGQYKRGLEADVINLLAGPLAEAKYVALRDDEIFNANIIYLGSLKFYGGNPDLKKIYQHMQYLVPDKEEWELKLAELFLETYNFIHCHSNWHAIKTLAEYILDLSTVEPHTTIPYEDIVALLEPENEPPLGQYTPLLPGYLEMLMLR